jgi:hypothetical protein
MRKFFLLIALLLFFGSTIVQAQRILNIEARPSGNTIIVDYSIKGAKFYQKFDVELYVSRDGGITYEGPLKYVSGDVGDNILSGDKSIIWNVLDEIPVINQDFVFDIKVNVRGEGIKKRFFVQYVGNMITPVGVRVGILGKTNFYLEARASMLFNTTPGYEYTNGAIDNFNQSGYYMFTGSKAYVAQSVLAGLTFQAGKTTFFYLGGGFGSQKFVAEIGKYSYSENSEPEMAWASDTENVYSGGEAAAGIILNPGRFVISAGATALNFELFNFTAGFGYAF